MRWGVPFNIDVWTGLPCWIFYPHVPWKLKNMDVISVTADTSNQMFVVMFIEDLWAVMPAIRFSQYTCDTVYEEIWKVPKIECSISLVPIVTSLLNFDNSCFLVLYTNTRGCQSTTDIALGISMTSKYGGTTDHHLFILLSHDFWHNNVNIAVTIPSLILRWVIVQGLFGWLNSSIYVVLTIF